MKIVTCSSPDWLAFAGARVLPRNFVSPHELPERLSSIALGFPGPISRWDTEFIFDYVVFPFSIMRFEAEWRRAGRSMAVGDVVVQRVVFPPVGRGLCLQFAVRVSQLIRDTRRLGFAYETLEGHVESGLSEFYFEEREDGLHFVIHTFSRPAHWSSRIVRHVFSDPYQAWCTRRALEHVRRTFCDANAQTG